jgi:hypothetical protein
MAMKLIIALFLMLGLVSAFQSKFATRSTKFQISKTNLYEIPLELSGQLDASKVWDVTLEFNGVSKVVSISEGSSILDIAETVFDGAKNRISSMLYLQASSW